MSNHKGVPKIQEEKMYAIEFNAKSKKGETALDFAIKFNRNAEMKTLLEKASQGGN